MPYGSFCNAAVWHILESNFSNRMVNKKVQNSIVAKSRLSHCESSNIHINYKIALDLLYLFKDYQNTI